MRKKLCLVLLTATLSLALLYGSVLDASIVYGQQAPTLDEEKPTYITFTDKQWWALYGYAYTSDKSRQLMLNFNVEYGAGWSLVESTLNGNVRSYNVTSVPPLWNASTNTLSGNIKGVTESGIFTLTFYSNEYRVWTISVADILLKVETWRIGAPVWASTPGEPENKMELVTEDPSGTPIYAGGWSEGIVINATLTEPTQTLKFQGWGNYARSWMKPRIKAQGYWTLLFLNSQPEFYLFVFDSHNPDNNQIFTHRGSISFLQENASYEFETFTVSDSGGGRPARYTIQGTFQGGSFDVTGVRTAWLQYGQNHPFISWTGTVTKGGKVINVDSLGTGEIFRGWVGINQPPLTRLLPYALVSGAVGIAVITIVVIVLVRRRKPKKV